MPLKKPNNKDNIKIFLILSILGLVMIIKGGQYLISWPISQELPEIQFTENDYLSLLSQYAIFKNQLKENGNASLYFTPQMLKSYLKFEPGVAKQFPVQEIFVNDRDIEIRLENKIKGEIYEIYLLLQPQENNGRLYLKVLKATAGRLKIPSIIAQKKVDEVIETISLPFYLKSIEINKEGISIIAKKL